MVEPVVGYAFAAAGASAERTTAATVARAWRQTWPTDAEFMSEGPPGM
jgi:hypothetical protein